MPVYRITHTTTYRYAQPVGLSQQAAHLEPLTTEAQECLHFKLEAQPRAVEASARTDYFGNRMHYLTITEPHREFVLTARSQVTVTPGPVLAPALSPLCSEVREWLEKSADTGAHQARQFLYASPYVPILPEVANFARRFFADERPILEGTLELSAAMREHFAYDKTATTTATPLEEFFQLKRGVCQDFAHLAVACLRASGLPARYMSGYLLTEPPEGQERLTGADASHAWVSVFTPYFGWVDFDPTNDIPCDERHITIARGRDYGDVAPVRGTVTGGGEQNLTLAVTVAPASEPGK